MKNDQRTERELISALESAYQNVFEIESRLKEHLRQGDPAAVQYQSMSDIRDSETRYRRLFESAQDGILILDGESGGITDANPYIIDSLGYSLEELLGKRLWEIGAFVDAKESKEAFEELKREKFIRYKDLPLKTKGGQTRQVEFVSNVYLVKGKKVIQCNIRDITERRQAEVKLEESRRHFQSLFENMVEGYAYCEIIYDHDIVHDFIYREVNSAFETVTGMKNVIGKKVSELIPGIYETDSDLFALYSRVASTGTPERQEVFVESLQMWLSLSVYSCGKNYFVAVFDDITDRKKGEESLRLLNSAVLQSGESIIITDAKLDYPGPKIIFVNPAFTAMTGYSAEEVIGKTPRILQGPQTDTSVLKRLRSNLEKGETFEGETFNYRKDGTSYVQEWQIAPIQNTSGSITHFVALQRDITERKQVEATLKESEEKFRIITENSADPIFIADIRGKYVYVNTKAAAMLGYSVEELLTRTIMDLTPKNREEEYIHILQRIVKEGKLFTEIELINKDGVIVPTDFNAVVLPNGNLYASCRDITERKQREKIIRESEKRFKALFDQAPIGIALMDMDKRPIIVNETFSTMLGYSNDELRRMKFTDFTCPDDKDEAVYKFTELLDGKVSHYDMEKRYVHKNGNLIWVNLFVTILRDEYGVPNEIIGMAKDISERKQAELALRFGEERYRLLFDNSIDAILLTHPDGRIISANPAACRIFGRTESEIIQSGREGIVDTSDPRLAIGLDTRNRTGKFTGEITLLRNDGTKFPGEISTAVFKDVSSNSITSMSIRDITERKKSENQIALLAHTLKSVSECVSITDLNETIIFVNTAFLRTYGYTENEILGKNISIVRSPNNPPRSTDGIRQATLNGVWNGELLNRTKEGHDFLISLSTSYVQDQYGKLIALVGVANDITEQKKLQQELLQSQKSESIGTLAGGIAHDFNNILGIILGYTSIIDRNVLTPKQLSESLAAIIQAVKRGSALVRQILTFARKTETLFEPISLSDLVQELVSMLQQTFPKIITFSNKFPNDIPFVFADRTQIHQALLNLCVNARDAMPHGGSICIDGEIRTGEDLKEEFPTAGRESYVCISVTDTGEGMSAATQKRIFDPFFTTKPQGKGTGLGLSVTYGVVQAHHGFINVQSELGHGTTFRIYFPISNSTMNPIASQENKKYDKGGTETILLVEDEVLLKNMVTMLLEAKGYTVLTAGDGAEAIEMYSKHKDEISAVITDLGLPIMTGMEEYRKLKEIDPAVKVVFASGFFDPVVKSELLNAGAKYFLSKPYMAEEILRTLRNVLDP